MARLLLMLVMVVKRREAGGNSDAVSLSDACTQAH